MLRLTEVALPDPTKPNPQRPKLNLLARVPVGIAIALLGLASLAAPLLSRGAAAFLLGILALAAGALQLLHAMTLAGGTTARSARVGAWITMAAGLLLILADSLVFRALALFLGLAWAIDGIGKIVAAFGSPGKRGRPPLIFDGIVNLLIGLSIGVQWPVPGAGMVYIAVGLRLLSAGWAIAWGRDPEAAPGEKTFGLPLDPQIMDLREKITADEERRWSVNRYWIAMLLLTFFVIHVGRMEAEWDLVGLFSPGVALIGDIAIAMIFAFGLAIPVRYALLRVTRPLERRLWKGELAASAPAAWGSAEHHRPTLFARFRRLWLHGRLRAAMRIDAAVSSPASSLRRGLEIGLPPTALLIALVPLWGISWYFNTENWATAGWERWAEHRTDAWRHQMAQGIREMAAREGLSPEELFRVDPDGIAGAEDFSFVVVGDCGEGDASQLVLKDQILALGQRPEVKFLLISSDVIYPQGAMKDYEAKFYLPFKGFAKPIYAIPGNHDWYDALEAFTANFFEPRAAGAAMRARSGGDRALTASTDGRIESMIADAGRLRRLYGLQSALQRAPYFEIQTDDFALIAIDTGILKSVDEQQMLWLGEALERARGKFIMTVIGHPLYAGGYDVATDNEKFQALRRLLQEHGVAVTMGGDTHDFEYYRQTYAPADGQAARSMLHFVNGGGGAYLSIGTSLAFPDKPPTPEAAIYPGRDAIISKLDAEVTFWKRPMWWWTKRLGAWPSTPETLASAFASNRAPFFQSFVEVRVERSSGLVRVLPYGASGRLRWGELQVFGAVIPAGQSQEDFVEFQVSLKADAAE